MKPRTCETCQTIFTPQRMGARACSPMCAIRLVKAEKKTKAQEKKADKARLRAIEPLSAYADRAQHAVNAYVRMRDRELGCCSCDKGPKWDGQWHASHLRSVGGASSVRYNLWNIAKGCSQCNNHLSGNLSAYLPRARERWGDERIDWLYAQNQPRRYTRDYLERMRAVFAKKLRRLERRIRSS